MSRRDSELQGLLEEAMAAAREASDYVAAAFRGAARVEAKGLGDLVTEVDTKAENLILASLDAVHPSVPVLTEETGFHGEADGDSMWMVDPLDGTVNFSLGIPFFAVSIAYVTGGEPMVAVVADPMRSEFYWAVKGSGAFMDGERLHVHHHPQLARGVVSLGLTHEIEPDAEAAVRNSADGARYLGCTALSLAYVAAGRFVGFVELADVRSWDVAAGLLVATEAGAIARSRRGHQFVLPHDDSPFGLTVGTTEFLSNSDIANIYLDTSKESEVFSTPTVPRRRR